MQFIPILKVILVIRCPWVGSHYTVTWLNRSSVRRAPQSQNWSEPVIMFHTIYGLGLVPAQHIHFFYVCSHFRAPQNGNSIISTRFLKGLFLNSLIHNLLFEFCTGLFFWKIIPHLCWKMCDRFMSLVLGCFPENTIFHFYISKELMNI